MPATKRQPGPNDDPVEFYLTEYAWELRPAKADIERPPIGSTAGLRGWRPEDEIAQEKASQEERDSYRYKELPFANLSTLDRGDREQRIACAAAMWETGMKWKDVADVVRVPVEDIKPAAMKFAGDQRFAAKQK